MIRKTSTKDLDRLMQMINAAKVGLKNRGVNQWQDGYPDKNVIEADIKKGVSYVSERGGEIAASAVISFEKEKCYEGITEGEWLKPCKSSYAVIHRIVASEEYQRTGAATELLNYAVSLCKRHGAESIKIDTHRDNKVMRQWLGKQGFVCCGAVRLEDGGERIAFEKLIL